jgi:pantoate--beta-alanine ligase
MKVINSVEEMCLFAEAKLAERKTIGLVPTMGALHDGHVALIRKARKKSDVVVLSIFVNPIQFSNADDLKNYPKTFKKDLKIAGEHSVDVVFAPSMNDFYPKDFSTYVTEEKLSKGLCGKSRPGHFRGVTTVVAKLFNIIQPHIAFFGHKDAQQALVIQKMVKDLCMNILIEVVSTVRDPEGLALSSRNQLLSAKEREGALSISEALFMAKVMSAGGETSVKKITQRMKKIMTSAAKAKIDYVEIVDAQTLEKRTALKGRMLVLVAAWFGGVRLIDNIVIDA